MKRVNNILRMQAGVPGEKEFNSLFRRYYKRLCMYAFQFVNDASQAEDIVQGCFIKLWEKRETIDWSYDTGAFLYRIVKNASYDFMRGNKNNTGLDILEEVVDEDDVRRVIMSETMEEIYAITNGLPKKCRNIFRMLFIEGKDNAQIANELKITESTIRTQKAKAISFLKLALRGLMVCVVGTIFI